MARVVHIIEILSDGTTREHACRQPADNGVDKSRKRSRSIQSPLSLRDLGTASTDSLSELKESRPNSLSKTATRVDAAQRLCDLLMDLMVKNGVRRKEVSAAWITDMERLIRIDERAPSEIARVIRWSQADDFWSRNILSPATLRKQFDRLLLAAKPTKRVVVASLVRTEILQAVNTFGRNRTPTGLKPPAQRVVDSIGWTNICNMSLDSLTRAIDSAAKLMTAEP